ncbi:MULTISPECIES: hypothetical protein [Enterobacter cloacae complex]|uniref:hypothetical protein n=1 Tax=Enterobacter cloacae complex TaxID=354276 RepID=UPI002DBD7F76|nr:hypothetical protein [Enterobacter roggenkampii]MEB6513672.1 hypothetical protein [Enterobacter roggenkampii]
MAFNDNGKRVAVPGATKLEALLKSSERELMYYVHFLQCNDKTRRYISGMDYADINQIKALIQNALYKSELRGRNIDYTIDEMINSYREKAMPEEEISWLKGERRACFWFLFNVLIRDTPYSLIDSIINNNKLNTHSKSAYYSAVAWLDKEMYSWEHRDVLNEMRNYEDKWMGIKSNKAYPWLAKKEPSDITYCYTYLKDKGMGDIIPSMSERKAAFILEFCEASGFEYKDIIMAFFDYLHGAARNGHLVTENLMRKMSSGLSSWRSRKNKDGYSDLHFDIRDENIPKLKELQKIFRLPSRKDVVNELIERFYEQYNKS